MWNIIVDALPSLFGGLALFIFGMNFMAEGLQKSAGEKMRHILKILTKNPLMGVIVGALVTTVLQSSSATTVMVVGFVSAGLMTLRQAIGVIMGANIGTTVIAWLVSININDYAFHILAIGFFVFLLSKNQKIKHVAQVFFGFGILFVGLNIMSDAMRPLATSEDTVLLMANVSNNSVLGVVIGAVVTGIVQSSGAIIAVIQKLSQTITPEGLPLVGITAAIPLVLGSNIGTTVTALFASIGSNRNAKRAAFVHVLFNVIGSVIFVFFIPQAAWLIELIMGKEGILYHMDTAIAYFHTIFNVTNTLLMFPFISLLEKMANAVYRGSETSDESPLGKIDKKIFSTPAIAMDLAVSELKKMSKVVQSMVTKTKQSITALDQSAIEETFKLEDQTDLMKRNIVDFLSKILSHSSLTESQSVRLTGLMHMAHDIERMGDNCMDIAKIASNMIEAKIRFSDSALEEITSAFSNIENIIDEMVKAFEEENFKAAELVIEKEAQFDHLEETLRNKHIERLNAGQCKPDSAIPFIELIHYIERMSDSCKNVAESVLDDLSHKLFSEH